jgi:hypothetical protein
VLVLASAEGVALITGISTIVGAAILAGVAAVTTNRRLTKQIAAERERQERDLRAAVERQREELHARTDGQEQQLNHARELADLADLRALLDEAAVALDHARKARGSADANLLGVAEAISSGALTGTPARSAQVLDPMVEEAADTLEEAGQPLVTLIARLQVRLGTAHPITTAFRRASAALHDQWRALAVEYPKRGLEAIEEDARHAGQEFGLFNQDFLDAAVELAGTVTMKGHKTAAEQS